MADRLKVIQLIEEISDGGAETQLKNYMLYLDRTKFDCMLLTKYVNECSANYGILHQHHVPLHSALVVKRNLPCKIINKLQRIVWQKDKIERLYQWYVQSRILAFKPDIIHVHLKMLHYLMPIADQLKGIKIYYRCASKPERYFNEENDLERSELEAARYLLAHNGLQMIALNSQMRDAINELFGISNTKIIRNVFDIAKYQAKPELTQEQIREEIEIPKDAFVLGHVGRCFYIKNQSFLVDVFKHVAEQNKNAYLLMIGGGDFSEIIAKLQNYGLSDKYKILSARKDVNVLLHAMDVFVFPSLLEGMPGALIEAQAAGLKCIASSSITNEAIVSPKAIQMDLNAGAENWADKIIKDELKGAPQMDIMSFDVTNVMKDVEQLYRE